MTRILDPAPWLANDRIGLRAPELADVPHADRWFIGDGPADGASVERQLRRRESIPWGGNPVLTLVAIDLRTGHIAGGIMATRSANRVAALQAHVPPGDPDRGTILRDILTLAVPWLLYEVGLMTAVLDTPADDSGMVEAALQAGMVEAVRRREHILRPGGRVDLLQLERVNRMWGQYAG
jgi:RimJ/RimL family protein N-acetyltransferase